MLPCIETAPRNQEIKFLMGAELPRTVDDLKTVTDNETPRRGSSLGGRRGPASPGSLLGAALLFAAWSKAQAGPQGPLCLRPRSQPGRPRNRRRLNVRLIDRAIPGFSRGTRPRVGTRCSANRQLALANALSQRNAWADCPRSLLEIVKSLQSNLMVYVIGEISYVAIRQSTLQTNQ